MTDRRRDALIAAGLCAVTATYLAVSVRWAEAPAEDAAILLRYAAHVAGGHGFVWNVGEPPVDGATDFLFVFAVAGLARAGLSIEAAARALGAVSHLAAISLIYFAPRRLYGASRAMCAGVALYVAVGPARDYIGAAFGTPFFAMWVALAWAAALVTVEHRVPALDLVLPLLACVMGMARPEGALLGAAILVAVAASRGPDGARALARMGSIFVVAGGAYFLARWYYFGHPFPNPYYVKGNGRLYWASLNIAAAHAVRLTGPLLGIAMLGLGTREGMRRLVVLAGPCVVFVVVWLLLSDEMNYAMRFQYPLLPLVALAVPGVTVDAVRLARDRIWPTLSSPVRWGLIGSSAAAVTFVFWHQLTSVAAPQPDGRRDVGRLLAAYGARGYTMVVSEAGLLPFYSDWRTVDAWGLNDAEIARRGYLTAEYLERQRPALVAFHAAFSPLTPWPRASTERWDAMTITLHDFAERGQYVLAAAYGHHTRDVHYFYVRTDLPDADRIVAQIRSTPYYLGDIDERAVDYARMSR